MEWISVEDEMPPRYEDVVAIGRDKHGRWCKDVLRMGDDGWIGMYDVVPTHWMPLPEPPVDKDGG